MVFASGSLQSAPLLRFQPIQSITFPAENAQEAERTVGVHFLGKETAGRCDFGGICRKILEGEEVLLSGAQGLFERKRVALRAALPLNNSSDS
mgnify:CR=1 FL=1